VFSTLAAALAQWTADLRPDAVITILDSRNYQLPSSVTLRNEGRLVIEAANRQRPLLQTPTGGTEIEVSPPAVPADADRNGVLTLSGALVEGFLHVTGDLGLLRLLHTTLVPGRSLDENGDPIGTAPSLVVEGAIGGTAINTQLRVQAAFSITGPLVVPEACAGVAALDSIIDGLGGAALAGAGAEAGPPLTVERSTLWGTTHVKELDASESIFTDRVETVRVQQGC